MAPLLDDEEDVVVTPAVEDEGVGLGLASVDEADASEDDATEEEEEEP